MEGGLARRLTRPPALGRHDREEKEEAQGATRVRVSAPRGSRENRVFLLLNSTMVPYICLYNTPSWKIK